LTTIVYSSRGSIRFAKYLEIHWNEFDQIFWNFGGPPTTPNPSKPWDLTKGFWGRGWGRKKFDPHISPIWGPGKPNLFFPWGADRGYLAGKTYEASRSPQNSTVSRNFGGWVPEHGVLRGLPSSECRTKFLEHLGRKYPDPIFLFFELRPRGWTMPPQKMVKFLTFFKIHEKSREWNIRGLRAHEVSRWQTPPYSGVGLAPPSPKFFGEPKQNFEISANLGLPAAKTLRCIRTKFSGFVDMCEVNKSP